MNSIEEMITTLIEYELTTTNWKTHDTYYEIKRLSIDQRGRVGEHFLRDVFQKLNRNVVYVNNDHGDWDIEIDGYKVEVKLATLDVNNKFQHEGVKSSKLWDMVAFVDVAPNNLYVTFIHKDKFEFNDKHGTFILNGELRKSHFRGKDNGNKRATGAGYKVDFPLKFLKEVGTIEDIAKAFDNEKKNN